MDSLFAEGEEEEELEAGEQALAGSAAEAVQGHVQVIVAMQRVQASQAGYTADPALQGHRPKLRDNRWGSTCALHHLASIMAAAALPLCCCCSTLACLLKLSPGLPTPDCCELGCPVSKCACRPRLLFQYLPYVQQEALHLAETDIQAVLEASFGSQGPHSQWQVRCIQL